MTDITTARAETAVGRTIEEIGASLRLNMMDMVNRAIAIGQDLAEAKELLGHGKFLPWLKDYGISSSTAANYMRVAREIQPGSRLSALPYSKALALLSAPKEEREALAAETEDKSAAEIRRLIEERNRAAEAANTETARADQAEKDAKMFNQENAGLRVKIQNLESRIKEYGKTHDAQCSEIKKAWNAYHDEKERADQLKADLLFAENNRVEVEIEKQVVPDDYELLKRTQADLLAAAEEAEKRAADAEAELELLRQNADEEQEEPWKILKVATTRFFADCEMMPARPLRLDGNEARFMACISRLEKWTDMMRIAIAQAKGTEGTVE